MTAWFLCEKTLQNTAVVFVLFKKIHATKKSEIVHLQTVLPNAYYRIVSLSWDKYSADG